MLSRTFAELLASSLGVAARQAMALLLIFFQKVAALSCPVAGLATAFPAMHALFTAGTGSVACNCPCSCGFTFQFANIVRLQRDHFGEHTDVVTNGAAAILRLFLLRTGLTTLRRLLCLQGLLDLWLLGPEACVLLLALVIFCLEGVCVSLHRLEFSLQRVNFISIWFNEAPRMNLFLTELLEVCPSLVTDGLFVPCLLSFLCFTSVCCNELCGSLVHSLFLGEQLLQQRCVFASFLQRHEVFLDCHLLVAV